MLLADLQAASFRGASFLVPADDAEEGRQAVKHNYPDASFQYMEDNGLLPPCFKITAVLHGDGLPGKLSRLRRALNTPGPGVLKHPYYGTQFVQVDGTYQVHRDDRQSGVIERHIPSAVTGPPRLPGLVSGVAAYVSGLVGAAISTLFSAFVSSYGTPTSSRTASAISVAVVSLADVLDLSFGQATSAPAQMLANPDKWVRNPSKLSELLIESFNAPLADVTISNRDLVTKFASVADTASGLIEDAAAINATTPDLVLRRASIEALGVFCEASAFSAMADAMAGRTYTTADEVEFDEAYLTDLFEVTQSRGLPAEQHAEMAAIYIATSEVLRDTAVRLPRLAEVAANNIPASVLAYELYENNGMTDTVVESRVQTLVDLNLEQDPILFAPVATALIEG